MSDDGKPRGRSGKPFAPRGDKRNPSGGKDGLKSRGFKGAPAGARGGKPGERKSSGFRDRPDGFKPRFRDDKPREDRPREERDGDERPREFKPRGDWKREDRPRGDKPFQKSDRPFKKRDDAAVEAEAAPEGERIAKRLARAGVASRREAEALILDGRITVNGKVLDSPALNVTGDDKILIDGKPIPQIERTRLWLYHKPSGLVTSNRDPEGRPTVFDNLPEDLPRVMSVGRLDINTEGLLLLTNDGGLARVLELPQTGWLRRYRVRAHGRVNQMMLDTLKDGIAVDGVFYGAIEATLEREQGSNVWIEMALREGKNREIKNVLGALGLEVTRLIRVSYGPFQLGALEEGAVLEVRGRMLRDQLGERLVEESGANFDAPVVNQFPNKPVRRSDRRAEEEELKVTARKQGDWVSGTRSYADKREKALDRLTTKRPDQRREGYGSNVWMASGARPQKMRAKPEAEEGTDAPAFDKKKKWDGGKPGFKKPDGDRKFGDKKFGDKKFSGKKFDGKKFDGEKTFDGDKPRERKFSDKPRSDRPYGDKPRGDKPYGDKPRGGGFKGKPSGGKPDGSRPSGGRNFGSKNGGGRGRS